jgi:hypothetical protein
MNHPIITNSLGQMRYQEMLHEAEVVRRVNQNAAKGSLRTSFGSYLVALGQRLKTQQKPQVIKPA